MLTYWAHGSKIHPTGISFKVKINEKGTDLFMAINLNESGRIEYRTQWKEEYMATIEDIWNTYNLRQGSNQESQ